MALNIKTLQCAVQENNNMSLSHDGIGI